MTDCDDISDNFQITKLSESNSFSIQTVDYVYGAKIELFDLFFQVSDSTF